MIECPHCQELNMKAALFCDYCGESLETDSTSLSDEEGTNTEDEYTRLGIRIDNNEQTLIVTLDDNDFLIGRIDSASSRAVDLDLTPYGAFDKGVSRNHLEFYLGADGLMAVDLGSVNGSFLNDQQLSEGEPNLVYHGDEIRLGKLVLEIYFI